MAFLFTFSALPLSRQSQNPSLLPLALVLAPSSVATGRKIPSPAYARFQLGGRLCSGRLIRLCLSSFTRYSYGHLNSPSQPKWYYLLPFAKPCALQF